MVPDPAAVERHLEAVFESEQFASAPKMRALLRYLVEATMAGDVERLKGYAIGIDVFERGADFDPGADDAIRIVIPKGGYTVVFETGEAEPVDDGETEAESEAEHGAEVAAGAPHAAETPHGVTGFREALRHLAGPDRRRWVAIATAAAAAMALAFIVVAVVREDASPPAPTEAISLAVLPFTNMSDDAANLQFGDGLTDALTTALARVKSLSVASRTSAFQYREATDLRQVGRELGVRYIIEGGLQQHGSLMRINVQLIDAATGAHIWAHNYDRNVGDDRLDAQGELVTTLAAEIRPRLFTAAKRAIQDNPTPSATAWQLFLQSTWVPGEARNSLAWEKERVALARRALELDPDLGQADSVLADKLAYLANVDPPSDTDKARASAAAHARRALELAPDDADAMFNLAIHHWHAGQLDRSLEATQRTLDLDPNHVLARFLVKAVPFTCAAAPQEVVDELIAFDQAISPDNPVRWVTLTWISLIHLNNGDLARAAEAARRSDQVFRTPDTLFRLGAILVQQGDAPAGVAQIAPQRENWPNLDPRHYAEVAIPRRCGSQPKTAFLTGIYGALADAFDAARAGK